ncbi:MAG TPA: PilZ domain-containing protein [Candidatus Acidoferrum sp.]|nr:PilZ domain-containing protein [Candidatus Acidoferrum sp.]
MAFRAIVNRDDAKDGSKKSAETPSNNTSAWSSPVAPTIVSPYSPAEPTALDVQRCLKDLHILFRSERLYQRNHPRVLESLESAYEQLRSFAFAMNGIALRVERSAIVIPKLSEAPLPDVRGELQALAVELQRAGIQTLIFQRRFHVGELDTLAQLLKTALLKSEESSKKNRASWWTAKLLENGVEGIQVNTQTDRKVDTMLASLIAALVAFGGNAPRENADAPLSLPSLDDLSAALRLLARLTPPLEAARGISPEEAARAIHGALEEASRETVHLLLSAISQNGPRDAEKPQPYLLRLSETLVLEFIGAEFFLGQIPPQSVRSSIFKLADVLVTAGSYSGPHASQHFSTLSTAWASEKHREKLLERFWVELPPREKSAVLRGQDVWCVPVSALRQSLSQLAEAGVDAPRREARNILLNFARRLEIQNATARRQVAAGLNELSPIIESLWPNQFPEDLSRGTLQAMETETQPETAALLAAFLETLGRIAVTRGDFTGLENILLGLERVPREPQFAHMQALAQRLIAQDRWMLLIDAALANRALDPALPRLLQRDPERLLDRLTLLLTDPRGFEYLPAMARLLRTIGVPVLNLLESRLYEARRQRVTAAIKLLSAADPERLLRGLPRALASWEWNLQDLAVSELSRPATAASIQSSAFIFSAILADAHPLVVPMMIDQIGLAMEATAVPQMMEIAAGEHDILRDQFVRIKAIEALGRMRATESSELLRSICEKREGLTHVEPAGLRAAAEDALAMIENRPTSARIRAAFEATTQASAQFVVPRRYTRVPLESPLRAQIEQGAAGLARVKTISLGGAYLESPKKLTVGDSIKLEVRSGLKKIHFTAVVRNIGPDGNGVEFVHMKDEDREKLRKLVQRHLQF